MNISPIQNVLLAHKVVVPRLQELQAVLELRMKVAVAGQNEVVVQLGAAVGPRLGVVGAVACQ